MKKLLIILCLLPLVALSQTKEESSRIIETYNTLELQRLYKKYKSIEKEDRNKVEKFLKENKIDEYIFGKKGSIKQLMKITNDGFPLYYTTDNADAAFSSRANKLQNRGGLGLNLEGQDILIRVWDGGFVPPTHQELLSRVENIDFTNYDSSHATHVTGTLIASGIQPAAKGMAPQAQAKVFDWDSDRSEAIIEALNGAILSNHSYGFYFSGAPSWFVGSYNSEAKAWDEICYAADYYLPVMSAGNDGWNYTPSGYDKLTGCKVAKNNLVVANGRDSYLGAFGTFVVGNINYSSSEGPADDGRIKPDITGNGTSLYSCVADSDTSYDYYSGTSMAAPNVTGTLALLQQHYKNLNNNYLRAATLKALATNTADDKGSEGPDPIYGWGYINAEAAVNVITNNGFSSWISEEMINNDQTYNFKVMAEGNGVPLKVSVVWTDPAGNWVNDVLLIENNITPALVNDLDVRVTEGDNIYFPWRLPLSDVSSSVRDGDNFVDNVEGVFIDNPSPIEYTITVSHKGNLVNNKQRFGLVVTGINSNFRFNTKTPEIITCSTSDAFITFDYEQVLNGMTNFTVNNLPNGMVANFDNASMSSNGEFVLMLSNLSEVSSGLHKIYVTGNDGFTESTRTIFVTIYQEEFDEVLAMNPENLSKVSLDNLKLEWEENLNAEEYLVELSTDISFENIIVTDIVTETELEVSDLIEGEVYYWRVTPMNRCGVGEKVPIFRFQVGNPNCFNYEGGYLRIPEQGIVSTSVEVLEEIEINDVNLTVDVQHSWIGDLDMTLISPLGTRVLVFGEFLCSDQTRMHLRFDDFTNEQNCIYADTNYPELNTFSPMHPLQVLNTESSLGEWKLEIYDKYANDFGELIDWELEICDIKPFIQPTVIKNNPITVHPNGNHSYNRMYDLEVITENQTPDNLKYTIIELPTFGKLFKNDVMFEVGSVFTQQDINNGIVNYKNELLSTNSDITIDTIIVDVENDSFGWLPNQVLKINIDHKITDDIDNLIVYPNPSNGIINFNNSIIKNVDLSISDIRGRIVYESTDLFNIPNKQINVSYLSSGTYIFIIKSNEKTQIKKILIK